MKSTGRLFELALRKPVAIGLCLAIAHLLVGCNLLIPLAFLGEHKEKVPAEFAKLAGKQAAVVVWAAQETLFDYPHVRLELGTHIGDRLREKVDSVRLVDSRKVEDYIQRSLSNAASPEEIAGKFSCEMVVYVELLEFQIRDPEAPDYLRARIHASVAVYDFHEDNAQPKRFELREVETVYPASQALLFSSTNAVVVRKQAYELFADSVACKFYDHEKEL